MERVRDLRKKAALYRRTASVPTNGSTSADRALLKLAEALEHEATTIERLYMHEGSSSEDLGAPA